MSMYDSSYNTQKDWLGGDSYRTLTKIIHSGTETLHFRTCLKEVF